eukprot:3533761-Rhodomonas_salina.1
MQYSAVNCKGQFETSAKSKVVAVTWGVFPDQVLPPSFPPSLPTLPSILPPAFPFIASLHVCLLAPARTSVPWLPCIYSAALRLLTWPVPRAGN